VVLKLLVTQLVNIFEALEKETAITMFKKTVQKKLILIQTNTAHILLQFFFSVNVDFFGRFMPIRILLLLVNFCILYCY
jgi:hypothetical protein